MPPDRIELSTSPLPRVRSTTELRRPRSGAHHATGVPAGATRVAALPAGRPGGPGRHDVVIKAPPICQDASLGWPSILRQEAGHANPRPVLQAVAGGTPCRPGHQAFQADHRRAGGSTAARRIPTMPAGPSGGPAAKGDGQVTRETAPKAAAEPAASERLARALRDNLRRRKRQQALRSATESPGVPPPSPARGAPSAGDGGPGVPAPARRP